MERRRGEKERAQRSKLAMTRGLELHGTDGGDGGRGMILCFLQLFHTINKVVRELFSLFSFFLSSEPMAPSLRRLKSHGTILILILSGLSLSLLFSFP